MPPIYKDGKYDPKASNPKDAIGSTKLPLDLIPDTGLAYAALAFLEGALKYGKFNWRIAGVKWSVYEAALKRHLQKVKEGEWADPTTKVPHLGSALACLMIAIDAYENGCLIDDRPPSFDGASDFIDGFVVVVEHLKKYFKDHNPHQYTIKDNGKRGGKQINTVDQQEAPRDAAPRKDVQSIPGWDGRHVVQRGCFGPVGGMEMDSFDPETKARAGLNEAEGSAFVFTSTGKLVRVKVQRGEEG